MAEKITLDALYAMKRAGRKIVGMVAWDFQIAQIVDRAGVDIVSVGDTVGVNLWGHETPHEVTLDEMILVGKAVRKGVKRALLSVDFPSGILEQGVDAAVAAAKRIKAETGADIVKLDGAAEHPECVTAVAKAGVPVFAQFGITPQTAIRYGIDYAELSKTGAQIPPEMKDEFVRQTKMLEAAGAALLDITNAGPVIGAAVTQAARLPVIGGFGGGPFLDGRMRMSYAAIGYMAKAADSTADNYANVARIALEALEGYVDDVRSARQIRGQAPAKS
ncbi:MAG: 3-methyl-2-oxobutanoate hydroxymethyltransferase [Pseudomonadota bacterium]|jgi:3-methyl-2-oxobutanoate hydroxymethyltransferase